jgi:molecular chaperone DnaK (HSP70)
VLRGAGLKASQVDAVYLAGGATLMTCVRDGIAGYFGRLPRCDFDPMEVVAIGASLVDPSAE